MDEIRRKITLAFEQRGMRRGGILFLSPSVAIDMIRTCRQYGVCILGIDGFVLSDDVTRPDMGNSVDFSSRLVQDSWMPAERFVTERAGSGLQFEVVI